MLHNKLLMYMNNFIIIYDVVNLFSIKKYKPLRKLRVGMNRYTDVNWSTSVNKLHMQVQLFLCNTKSKREDTLRNTTDKEHGNR